MSRHAESQEQRLFVQRWRMDPLTRDMPACAIPNGGRRGKIEAAIMVAEGVSAGAPDWICFRPTAQGYNGVALEFKSPTGKGRISPAQADWHRRLRDCGWIVEVVTSAHDAWAVVTEAYQLAPPTRATV